MVLYDNISPFNQSSRRFMMVAMPLQASFLQRTAKIVLYVHVVHISQSQCLRGLMVRLGIAN